MSVSVWWVNLMEKPGSKQQNYQKFPYCVEVLIEVGLIPGLFAWEKILLSQ